MKESNEGQKRRFGNFTAAECGILGLEEPLDMIHWPQNSCFAFGKLRCRRYGSSWSARLRVLQAAGQRSRGLNLKGFCPNMIRLSLRRSAPAESPTLPGTDILWAAPHIVSATAQETPAAGKDMKGREQHPEPQFAVGAFCISHLTERAQTTII